MERQFTEEWFYTIFSQPKTRIDFWEREIAVSASVASTPELRGMLKTNEDVLEVNLCVETPSFSPCVIFLNIPDENDGFDDTDSLTALAALKRVIQERYHMGIVSCWHQQVDQDVPGYRPLSDAEKERIGQYILKRHQGSSICQNCQTVINTLENLVRSIAEKLDCQDTPDSSLLDYLVCVSNLKRKILEYGLPTISDADMFYEIEINRKEIAVKLCHVCPLYEFDRMIGLHSESTTGQTSAMITRRSTMISYEFPLLSCADFAERCGVEQVTVRQWIRRGKLRSAIRVGRDWKIPSTTKKPQEGFIHAEYHVVSLPPEKAKLDYPFLNEIAQPYNSFCIEEAGAGTYLIIGESFSHPKLLSKMTRTEREEFERYLLEADWVEFDLQPQILKIPG